MYVSVCAAQEQAPIFSAIQAAFCSPADRLVFSRPIRGAPMCTELFFSAFRYCTISFIFAGARAEGRVCSNARGRAELNETSRRPLVPPFSEGAQKRSLEPPSAHATRPRTRTSRRHRCGAASGRRARRLRRIDGGQWGTSAHEACILGSRVRTALAETFSCRSQPARGRSPVAGADGGAVTRFFSLEGAAIHTLQLYEAIVV